MFFHFQPRLFPHTELMANLHQNSGQDQQMEESLLQQMVSLQQNSSHVPDQQDKNPQQNKDDQKKASHQRNSSQVPYQQNEEAPRGVSQQRNSSQSQEQIEEVRRMAWHQRNSSQVPDQQNEEVPRVISQQRNSSQFLEQQIEEVRRMTWLQHQRNSSHLLDQQMVEVQRMINRSQRIEDIGAATGFNPDALATGRKILGRGGRDIKATKATQTITDTSGTENEWIHESRRKADALCEEITNLINVLFHAPVSPRNQKGSITKSPDKNAIPPTDDLKRSAEGTV